MVPKNSYANNPQKSVAPVLKALREQANLSQVDMAEAAGLPPTTYNYYETTYKKPALPRLPWASKIAGALMRAGIPQEDVDRLFAGQMAIRQGQSVTVDRLIHIEAQLSEILNLQRQLLEHLRKG